MTIDEMIKAAAEALLENEKKGATTNESGETKASSDTTE